MRKADIRVPLGMRMLHNRADWTSLHVQDIMNRFFKGCRTTAEMEARIKLNGGYDTAAEKLSKDDRVWRTQ